MNLSEFELNFEKRKIEHIDLSLDRLSQAQGLSGLDSVSLSHDALPELNFNEVNIQSEIFNQKIKTPFFIAGMTAGHENANLINFRLAQACISRGWAMGVGSQRREIETPERYVDQWKKFRDQFPDLILFSNIGVSQVIALSAGQIKKITDSIQAQALVVHLNSLQEVIQKEGTPFFKGAITRLSELTSELKIPLIIKETGCGFSEKTILKIKDIPFYALDVSGLGGTHWGRIEGERSGKNTLSQKASQTFCGWGESTVQSVLNARKHLTQQQVWASGGVRSGLDAAKLFALGADRVGFAQPALQAALFGEEDLIKWMEQIEYELKIALFCTGYKTVKQLTESQGSWKITKTY